ncbi:hypothetical protein EJ02DRAFT_473102 [Clathrospora elynae]|uniref:Uncharacterized protein n=1 Tax=Clathrospora elynae TaxID=706981 RepID=A0A6A5SDK0_9PLEO|nr:hypothetical protein EJ02DRAFT_473102 [Clathrospora elynae]
MSRSSLVLRSLVIFTQYTTVTPTEYATAAPSVSSTPSLSSMMHGSSFSAGLSSSIPISSAISTFMSHITPTPTMTVTLAATPILSIPRAPVLPTSSLVPAGPKPKFDDTFPILSLTVIIVLAVLLCTVIGHMIYSRCKGNCPNCKDLKRQIAKYQSGDLKRITTDMVKIRAVVNKTASTPVVSADIDLEMGFIGDPASARAAALNTLQANKKPSLWQKAKGKVTGKGKGLARSTDTTENESDEDLFFTVALDTLTPGLRCIPSPPPQVRFPPVEIRSSQPPSPTYSASVYSQSIGINGSRAFTDHTGADIPTVLRGPVRNSIDGPKRYTAMTPC